MWISRPLIQWNEWIRQWRLAYIVYLFIQTREVCKCVCPIHMRVCVCVYDTWCSFLCLICVSSSASHAHWLRCFSIALKAYMLLFRPMCLPCAICPYSWNIIVQNVLYGMVLLLYSIRPIPVALFLKYYCNMLIMWFYCSVKWNNFLCLNSTLINLGLHYQFVLSILKLHSPHEAVSSWYTGGSPDPMSKYRCMGYSQVGVRH